MGLFVAALGGCGGNPDITPAVSVAPDLVIDESNATAVTGAAFDAAFETSELAGAPAEESRLSSRTASITRLAQRSFAQVAQKTQPGVVAVGPVTEGCAVGGTTTFSGQLANALVFTAGDRISGDFKSCDDGEGQVIDGTLQFLVDRFSGDLAIGSFDLTVTLTLTDFQVHGGGETTLANGEASIRIDTTQPATNRVVVLDDAVAVVSGTRAVAVTDSGAVPDDTVAIPVTLHASGNVDSSEIGGLISYATLVTFQGFAGEYPYAGDFIVDGANGTSARLIVLDNRNVRIEVDSDGDSAVDEIINTTWKALVS